MGQTRLGLVLEGVVLEPDGRPADGAAVFSSAGGRAVVGSGGNYRLEVDVPAGAESVRVTAVGGGGLPRSASASAFVVGDGSVFVDTLSLAPRTTCLPQWIPTFGSQPGTNDVVNALAVYDDGTGPALFVGGRFDYAGATLANHVAKWDGTSWSALGEGTNATVNALTVFDDGNGPALYASGEFSRAGGGLVRRIARWDGASWSALADGLSGGGNPIVHALAVHDDGNGPALYAGGSFLNSGPVSARRVARWDGTSWSALGAGVFGGVEALESFDDGSGSRLYVGGAFTSVGGTAANNVASWDGASWSALGAGTDSTIAALAVFDDGGGAALYAGGWFTNAGGAPAERIARWDGASWSSLGSGTDSGVVALTVLEQGGTPFLAAGGLFSTAGGVPVERVARWDGSTWTSLGGGPGLPHRINALTSSDVDGVPTLFVGGDLHAIGSVLVDNVAAWDSTTWSSLGTGLSTGIGALEVHDDGSGPALYAGSIGRWDGSQWTSLGGLTGTVNDFAEYDDGGGTALFATGFVSEAGGTPASNIARWDGASWSALGLGLGGVFSAGHAMTVYDSGLGDGPGLVVGGCFNSADGLPVSNIARWDGSLWSPLGLGVDDRVYALEVFDSGGGPELYAGGFFSSAGGASASNIAKWNGTFWSPMGAGVSGTVEALKVYDDGTGPALYVGGYFQTAGGWQVNRVARWDGSAWTALGGGVGDGAFTIVTSFEEFDDGRGSDLYVGGYFTVASGLVANRIARWDGAAWSALGSGMSGAVWALKTFNDGGGRALFAGGGFSSAFGSGDSYLARWGCDTIPPVLDCPTSVTAYERSGSAPGEVVTFTVTAVDDNDPAPTVQCVPPSGSLFPFGTTLVTCTATDSEGNEAGCQFPVVVSGKWRKVGF